MSVEKYVEQDFQALETSFSKGEPLSEIALPRILENISKLDDADRIFHWHDELRRIGGLPTTETVVIETTKEDADRLRSELQRTFVSHDEQIGQSITSDDPLKDVE